MNHDLQAKSVASAAKTQYSDSAPQGAIADSHLGVDRYLYINMWKFALMVLVPFYPVMWIWRNWKIYRARRGESKGVFWRTVLFFFYAYSLLKDMLETKNSSKGFSAKAAVMTVWLWSPIILSAYRTLFPKAAGVLTLGTMGLYTPLHAISSIALVLFIALLGWSFFMVMQRCINQREVAKCKPSSPRITFRLQKFTVSSVVAILLGLVVSGASLYSQSVIQYRLMTNPSFSQSYLNTVLKSLEESMSRQQIQQRQQMIRLEKKKQAAKVSKEATQQPA